MEPRDSVERLCADATTRQILQAQQSTRELCEADEIHELSQDISTVVRVASIDEHKGT